MLNYILKLIFEQNLAYVFFLSSGRNINLDGNFLFFVWSEILFVIKSKSFSYRKKLKIPSEIF